MLKCIEELLVEAEAEIKERGLTLTFEEFNESADKATFVERKLASAKALLESNPRRVKKNNGRADNSPLREALKSDPNKARLVESFKALGLSQKEAEYASMSDVEIAETEFDRINPGVLKELYGQ
jgi:hypothetical protein